MARTTKIQISDDRDSLEMSAAVERGQDPITYEGESVVFDPKYMVTGFPHVFKFLDHYMAVIKSSGGTLNFFYFDYPDNEAAE